MTPYTINRIVNSVVGDSPIRVTLHTPPPQRGMGYNGRALLFEAGEKRIGVVIKRGTTASKLSGWCKDAKKVCLSGDKDAR